MPWKYRLEVLATLVFDIRQSLLACRVQTWSSEHQSTAHFLIATAIPFYCGSDALSVQCLAFVYPRQTLRLRSSRWT
ncbi:hypothetical protein BDR03DRAFT_959072 [Suillus americanus]|nr:hypothetical protein BDR03DRAFT_959072 [Suillus americanus]